MKRLADFDPEKAEHCDGCDMLMVPQVLWSRMPPAERAEYRAEGFTYGHSHHMCGRCAQWAFAAEKRLGRALT